MISKLIKPACNCTINCYLQYMIGIFDIFNISIFRKGCSFSVPSWLEKKEQPSWLGKKEHLFAKY